MEPKDLKTHYGAVFSGFSIKSGIFSGNSATLNLNDVQGYHNSDRALHPAERRLILGAIRIARARAYFNGQTISVADINKYWADKSQPQEQDDNHI